MANLLDNKVAVITGAASGNGRGIALAFAEHGAKAVIVADIREEPREGGKPTHTLRQSETQTQAKFVTCNVAKIADLEAAVEAAEEFGGIDIMVNNAGIILSGGAFVDATEEMFDRMMSINVKGVYFGAQAAAKRMLKKGSGCIINMSSVAGIQGSGRDAIYSTTKGAVRLMTYGLAQELGPKGIRVNAIHPGVIETAMTSQDTPIVSSERSEAFKAMIPLGKFGQPADIGNSAVYLASDLASYVNGASLVVDGGWMRV
jgi:NAD(P)-dependent dehydrogenase (short-subunit alcohol dehydrogenase family)